jgi:uncharacterized membrane protein
VSPLAVAGLTSSPGVPRFRQVLKRFLLYGAAGWVVETLFTGFASAIRRDRSARANTYLWMHPIYGGTALALEQVRRRMPRAPRWARALAYVGVIYGAEYGSGWLLRKMLGRCPWDYSGHGRNVHGLIRLDYAPAWYALALLFEPLQASLESAGEAVPKSEAPTAAPVGSLPRSPWQEPFQVGF